MTIEEFKEQCGCQTCRSKKMDKFKCLDCSINTREIDEYYMIEEDVWHSIVPGDEGMLCIGCLEKRLDRRLTPDDFLKCILNEKEYHEERSDRLLDRMGYLEAMEI
jgi:hypothetical protein